MENQNQVYAGFSDRFIALLIDSFIAPILISILLAVISLCIGNAGRSWMSMHDGFTIAYGVGWFLYFALQESSARQATFGKRAMGIRVADLNGNRISIGKAAVRTLLKVFSSAFLLFGYLMAAFTQKKQAFHDLISGCIVIPEPRAVGVNGPAAITQRSSSSKVWAISFASAFILLLVGGGYLKWIWWPHFKQKTMPKLLNSSTFVSGTLAEVSASNRTLPVLASESEYERFLAVEPSLPTRDPRAKSVGPALLQMDRFWPSLNGGPAHVWVTVKMSDVPNVNQRALISVRHVWTTNRSDVYDASSWNESQSSQRLYLSRDFGLKDILNANRDIYLISMAKEGEIKSIEGDLKFILPLDIAKLEWDATRIGQELGVEGIKIRLISLVDQQAVFQYTGSMENRVKVAGFDQNGTLLTNKEKSENRIGNNPGTFLTYNFDGTPKKIWFYVASRFFQKSYPFELTKD